MTERHEHSVPVWPPDWAVHPGEHLREYLEVRNALPEEFALVAGLSEDEVRGLLEGRGRITAETTHALEGALGLKAGIWIGLQAQWDDYLRGRNGQATQATRTAAEEVEWRTPAKDG